MPNLITLAVPFFFLLVAIEALIGRRLGRRLYRFPDAITDIGCGVASEVVKVFIHVALVAVYMAVYRYRLFELSPRSPWTWAIAIVGLDLCYYWWHRVSHEVNFLWAAHVVHHTSEDYNLAVALRQAIMTHFTSTPFYLPLALLGVPPAVYLASYAINLAYQFWIHTELIRKLARPVELVMNTPSHHRVHHGTNPQYLDRNYAGIFVIWDRLFGSFEPEGETPVYGTVKPLASYDALTVQFHYWGEMWRMAKSATDWRDKLRVIWKGPAWRPANIPVPKDPSGAELQGRPKYESQSSRGELIYAGVQFILALVLTLFLMLEQDRWPMGRLAVGAGLVGLTLVVAGGLFERRPWARGLEVVRLIGIAGAAVVLFS